MVQQAKDSLYEDLMNAYKYNELPDWLTVVPDPKAKASEIPEFLLEDNEH